MSGLVLRPCIFCNQSHLPQNCPQAQTLGPAPLEGPSVPSHNAFPVQDGYPGMQEQWRQSHQQRSNNNLASGGEFPRSNSRNAGHISQISKWQDDDPVEEPREFSNEIVHYNNLASGNTASHTHTSRHHHHPTSHHPYGALLGREGREHHRALGHEIDGDVKMSDVEDCDDCAFSDSQCLEHTDARVRHLTNYGWELRKRVEELRRLGYMDENFRPLFGEGLETK
jgi:hypothetical protein